MSSTTNLSSPRSFLRLLRVSIIVVRSSHLSQKDLGGCKEENQKRRKERRLDPRWLGGDEKGRVEKWVVVGGRGWR
jgi:hypothetical protein